MSRIKDKYINEIVLNLMKDFSFKSIMQVPKVKSIVLNVGMGEAIQDIKPLEAAAKELAVISGQKAVITRAKKSIAAFKLREGMPIGCRVTLRGDRMYNFLDKFISLALPRIRDFRGISAKSFDGRGNYSFGVREQIIFPEINYDKVASMHGMNVVIVTSAKTNEEGKALLKYLGMPFKN
ncbi:MAG: 50S ribosomal protein L5 [Thermodesulfovibrionia bacterium]|nr:50S ribosomal protein L5 [Thermodesulfovibrionia bacterium]